MSIIRIELKDIRTIEDLSDTLDEDIMAALPTVEQYQIDADNIEDKIYDIADQITEHPLGASVIVYDENNQIITCGDIEGCIDTILDEVA